MFWKLAHVEVVVKLHREAICRFDVSVTDADKSIMDIWSETAENTIKHAQSAIDLLNLVCTLPIFPGIFSQKDAQCSSLARVRLGNQS